MKVKLKVSSKAIVEAEGDKVTDLFEEIAMLTETFEEDKCGCCGSDDIRFIVRENNDGNKFYEIACKKCFARLAMGCKKSKTANLYPKRRWDALSPGEQENRVDQKTFAEKNRGYLPARGWFKWQKKDAE